MALPPRHRFSPATVPYLGQRRGSMLALLLRQYPTARARDAVVTPGLAQSEPGCGHGEHSALPPLTSARRYQPTSQRQSASLVELVCSVVDFAGQG